MSCGVFAISFLDSMLAGNRIPEFINPTDKREYLLAVLEEVDRDRLTPSQKCTIEGLAEAKESLRAEAEVAPPSVDASAQAEPGTEKADSTTYITLSKESAIDDNDVVMGGVDDKGSVDDGGTSETVASPGKIIDRSMEVVGDKLAVDDVGTTEKVPSSSRKSSALPISTPRRLKLTNSTPDELSTPSPSKQGLQRAEKAHRLLESFIENRKEAEQSIVKNKASLAELRSHIRTRELHLSTRSNECSKEAKRISELEMELEQSLTRAGLKDRLRTEHLSQLKGGPDSEYERVVDEYLAYSKSFFIDTTSPDLSKKLKEAREKAKSLDVEKCAVEKEIEMIKVEEADTERDIQTSHDILEDMRKVLKELMG